MEGSGIGIMEWNGGPCMEVGRQNVGRLGALWRKNLGLTTLAGSEKKKEPETLAEGCGIPSRKGRRVSACWEASTEDVRLGMDGRWWHLVTLEGPISETDEVSSSN